MDDWQAWIGREERRADRVDPGLVARWCATLDRAVPGDGIAPQGLHWCLGVPDAPTARLGVDGHPLRDDSAGSFFPPIPLPRRMWAASEVEFVAPLAVGEAVERVSRIASVSEKRGSSGALAFVAVAHETRGETGLLIRETQTLVYREPAATGSPPAPPQLGEARFDRAAWGAHRRVIPHEPLLFRFSALTFNTHRIHYDHPYATRAEGYRGLVVHGPLTASLLLEMAGREAGRALTRFAFRAVSPAIAGEGLNLVLRDAAAGWELGAFADDGRQVLEASAA